jgi:hypothetical protein
LYLRRYRHADWKQVYQLAQQVRPPHQGGVVGCARATHKPSTRH